MVPSMAWIMVASMIDMVIMVRLIGAPEAGLDEAVLIRNSL
jgi:hypothetical protein